MAGPYTLVPGSAMQTLGTTDSGGTVTGVTTGNGGIYPLHSRNARTTIVLQSIGTTSGGTISIEEAYYPSSIGVSYAGTWSVIQAVSASSFTGTAQLVVHVMAPVWAIRTRISSTITGGGTVAAWVWGN